MSKKKKKFWDCAGAALHILPDVGKPFLHDQVHAKFKTAIIESVVKLVFSVIAVCVAIFMPFGEKCSLWVSSLLFIGIFLWSIIESVPKYWMLLKKIIKKGSMRSGVAEFAKCKSSNAALASDLYDVIRAIGSRSSPLCQNLPSSDDIIWDFVCFLAKDIITFASLFSLYIILVHWIFKPIILEKFAGLTTMQIYLFPISQFLS